MASVTDPRPWVLVLVSATSAEALSDIVEKLTAALPDAAIGISPMPVMSVPPAELHRCSAAVRIPGKQPTEIRDTLVAIAPGLGVTIGHVLQKPGERLVALSYLGDGVADGSDCSS